jgi:uncharacterized protein
MKMNTYILEALEEEAASSVIDQIHLGLGYTAVTLSDGRCGLCSTWIEKKGSCTLFKEPEEFEGMPAQLLLQKISSEDTVTRTAVIALVNALNYRRAAALKDDEGELFTDLGLHAGSMVAMVGYFAPIVRQLSGIGVSVRAYDIGKEVGSQDEFYQWAREEADALILTATSVISNSTEEVFEHLNGKRLPTVIMGPSAIMIPEIYRDLPITICAGTVPTDIPGTLKAIRNGKGTPVLHRYARKVYCRIE